MVQNIRGPSKLAGPKELLWINADLYCSNGGDAAVKINEQVGHLLRLVHRHGMSTFVNNVYTPAAGHQLPQHLRTGVVNHLTKTHTNKLTTIGTAKSFDWGRGILSVL